MLQPSHSAVESRELGLVFCKVRFGMHSFLHIFLLLHLDNITFIDSILISNATSLDLLSDESEFWDLLFAGHVLHDAEALVDGASGGVY